MGAPLPPSKDRLTAREAANLGGALGDHDAGDA